VFDLARQDGVVEKVAYLADDFFPTRCGQEGGKQRSILDLPMFEGDYWPGEAEKIAIELSKSGSSQQGPIFKGKRWLWH